MLNKSGEYVGTITEGDLLWGIKRYTNLNLKEAYTKEHGKEAKWREELGYQRKRIGDFACYVSLIYGVFAR